MALNLRAIPVELHARLKAAAKLSGVSLESFCVGALGKAVRGLDEVSVPGADAGSNTAAATKPNMQALRKICAGNFSVYDHVTGDGLLSRETRPSGLGPTAEIPICGKKWWEDGEHYECLMDAGHREHKHGLRGMVRILDA